MHVPESDAGSPVPPQCEHEHLQRTVLHDELRWLLRTAVSSYRPELLRTQCRGRARRTPERHVAAASFHRECNCTADLLASLSHPVKTPLHLRRELSCASYVRDWHVAQQGILTRQQQPPHVRDCDSGPIRHCQPGVGFRKGISAYRIGCCDLPVVELTLTAPWGHAARDHREVCDGWQLRQHAHQRAAGQVSSQVTIRMPALPDHRFVSTRKTTTKDSGKYTSVLCVRVLPNS